MSNNNTKKDNKISDGIKKMLSSIPTAKQMSIEDMLRPSVKNNNKPEVSKYF